MKSIFDTIHSQWSKYIANEEQKTALLEQLNSTLTLSQYGSYLLELFHFTRLNPQIQAFTTLYFKGEKQSSVKRFLQHAMSEIGHDDLALKDLETLGFDSFSARKIRPLPETTALTAIPIYLVQFSNPVAYLGYLFHLEFMPTLRGKDYLSALFKRGIPIQATEFIREHAAVDVHHNNLMKKYIEDLVENDSDLEEVIYAAQVTCSQYFRMIDAALKESDRIQRLSK